MSNLLPVPFDPIPTGVIIYAAVVFVLSIGLVWHLDQRDNAASDAERMRQHLEALKHRTDTYLDPQGWNQ
jgi:hypothetical protein